MSAVSGLVGREVTHEDGRLGFGLKPERLEVNLVQGPLINDAVVASSQILLLVADKVCISVIRQEGASHDNQGPNVYSSSGK